MPSPADHRVKLKESVKRAKYLELARELNKLLNMKVTVMTIEIGRLGTISKETGRLENKRASGDYSDFSIIKIGQNTEKSPGELRRLAVTQTQKTIS